MRVNFSDLKAHRFKHRFNCDSPECNCDTGEESTEHYLILCPLFSVQRRNLLNDLTAILIEGDGIPQGTRLVSLILYGDHKFNDAKNKLILDLTIKGIGGSRVKIYISPQLLESCSPIFSDSKMLRMSF